MNYHTFHTQTVNFSRFWFNPNKFQDLDTGDEIFLQKVRACIVRRLPDQNFGVDDLARSIYLSVSQLNRRLNLLVERPAGQLIRELRLSFSAGLLAYSNKTIGEIAGQAGFSDQAHFCRSFKKCFQCTPSVFRRKYRRENRDVFFKTINARIWQNNAQNVQLLNY